MSVLDLGALLLTLAALFAWFNHRFVGLPTTIGLLLISLVASFWVLVVGTVAPEFAAEATAVLESIDFNETLMHGMLGALLFAGALHVDLEALAAQKRLIGALSTLGVVASTFLVGAFAYVVFKALGEPVPWMLCLLFGALISPTDPIAVLGILKSLGAPQKLATQIAGESLFNDGVGVVVFLAIFSLAGLGGVHGDMDAFAIAILFVQEAVGGALFGLVAGYLAYRMLASIDQYSVEVLITLALVLGGYALALALHISGPIAMVVAGLFMGNRGRYFAMSDTTREHLDTFWELIDEVLNAVLFVLMGFEVLVLAFTGRAVLAGLVLIPMALLGRFIAVGVPLLALRRIDNIGPHAAKILTWSGLRGGISIALALSIPRAVAGTPVTARDTILAVTYIIVAFSIVVQGLTIGPLIGRLLGKGEPAA